MTQRNATSREKRIQSKKRHQKRIYQFVWIIVVALTWKGKLNLCVRNQSAPVINGLLNLQVVSTCLRKTVAVRNQFAVNEIEKISCQQTIIFLNIPEKVERTTCEYNGKIYHEGTKFYPDDVPCHSCVCHKNFNASLPMASNKFCRKIDCGLELRYFNKIKEGCVPVYFQTSACCPIDFKCRKWNLFLEELFVSVDFSLLHFSINKRVHFKRTSQMNLYGCLDDLRPMSSQIKCANTEIIHFSLERVWRRKKPASTALANNHLQWNAFKLTTAKLF